MELYSPYLAALVLAWFLSHVIKYAVARIKLGKARADKKQPFFGSGGMPSAHTATITAVWMMVLLIDGWTSALFGLATVVLVIVAYDAATLRRSVGQLREIVTRLAKKSDVSTGVLEKARGHSSLEVIAGFLFGALVGLLVYAISSTWSW